MTSSLEFDVWLVSTASSNPSAEAAGAEQRLAGVGFPLLWQVSCGCGGECMSWEHLLWEPDSEIFRFPLKRTAGNCSHPRWESGKRQWALLLEPGGFLACACGM